MTVTSDRQREAPAHGQRQRRHHHQQHADRALETAIAGSVRRQPPRRARHSSAKTTSQPRRPASRARARARRASSAARARGRLVVGARRMPSMRRSSVIASRPALARDPAPRATDRRAGEQRLRRRRLDHHQRDDVRDRVVQLARHARALLGHRQPAAGRAFALELGGQPRELLRLAVQRAGEPARQPRPRGQRRHHADLGIVGQRDGRERQQPAGDGGQRLAVGGDGELDDQQRDGEGDRRRVPRVREQRSRHQSRDRDHRRPAPYRQRQREHSAEQHAGGRRAAEHDLELGDGEQRQSEQDVAPVRHGAKPTAGARARIDLAMEPRRSRGGSRIDPGGDGGRPRRP